MTRRARDFYQTPAWMTRALLHYVPEIGGTILEPCSGDQSIARELAAVGLVFTNDIDPAARAAWHLDAAEPDVYATVSPGFDWIITNPPYSMPTCTRIVAQSIAAARVGVAMMLRISFLEPTAYVNPRGPFHEANPPTRMLVMPRHSFTGNGKSDSATTAWMIWAKVPLTGPPMLSLYKADERFAA